MDRPTRTLMGCGLGLCLMLSGVGCKSMRPEVPPGRKFSGGGGAQQATPPIGFSTTPDPSGATNAAPPVQYGLPSPNGNNYGAPTPNSFGPPGTSTMSLPPALGGPNTGGADPTTGVPQSGTGPLNFAPAGGNPAVN